MAYIKHKCSTFQISNIISVRAQTQHCTLKKDKKENRTFKYSHGLNNTQNIKITLTYYLYQNMPVQDVIQWYINV